MTDPAAPVALSERVARAICEAMGNDPAETRIGSRYEADCWPLWAEFQKPAQAAIRATLEGLMEPDDDLRFAANDISEGFEELTGLQALLIGQALARHIIERECGPRPDPPEPA